MSEENTVKTNIEETDKTHKAPAKKVTKKKASTKKTVTKKTDTQDDFLSSFNWHQYQEGIDELDEKQIKDFDKIYKECKVFKLEQNYRSTKNILETASNLISNNSNRVGKKLWSSANQGELVKLNCYKTGKEEAQGISDIIEHNLKKKYSLNKLNLKFIF